MLGGIEPWPVVDDLDHTIVAVDPSEQLHTRRTAGGVVDSRHLLTTGRRADETAPQPIRTTILPVFAYASMCRCASAIRSNS